MSPLPRSDVPGIVWPAIPRIESAPVLSLLSQLEETQWWAPQRLLEAQLLQLQPLLQHARSTSPFWRERIDAAGFDTPASFDLQAFRRLPLLTRDDLQEHFDALASNAPPADHGKVGESRTSGSTGMPVRYLSSEMEKLYWDAYTLRDSLWHGRDYSAKFCVLRDHATKANYPDWGPPFSAVCETGPMSGNAIDEDVERLLDWLLAEDPEYLAAFPTVVEALIDLSVRRGERPWRLREISCYSELVPANLHATARSAWNVALTDIYSAAEVGYIALQCPEFPHYHVQAENTLVEILDDAGRACGPGEIGRVVLTPLHKFALPLIRYDIGDYAEPGEPCPCGRGLPVLRRIVGRTRNMVQLPDGQRFFPVFDTADWHQLFGARQLQLVQTALDHIEVRIVTDVPVDTALSTSLRDFLRQKLRYPFRITVVRLPRIERTSGRGKYEYFICQLPPLAPA